MAIENQILSRSGTLENETLQFDIGLFFRHLLLFDNYILDSIRLKEFPHLINSIGFGQTLELLKYKNFKIRCMALSIGSVGQTLVLGRTKETLLPLGSYAFSSVKITDRREYISDCLKCVNFIPSISFKQKKKLKKLIASKIIDEVPDIIEPALKQMHEDIAANTPAIKTALLIHLQNAHNIQKVPGNIMVKINQVSEKEFLAEQNLSEKLGLNEFEAHKAIERALLAVGGLNQRISEMKAFQALSGFQPQELQIFEDKLSFILNRISPDYKVEQFDRVIEIAGMPSFDDIGTDIKLNLDKFLKVRESNECVEFRNWLSEISNLEDLEIQEGIESFRNMIGSAIVGKVGKSIRFLASTIFGFLDGGAVTGPAIGAIDTFILDKIFPSKGPITFLNKKYPSIYSKLTTGESNKKIKRTA